MLLPDAGPLLLAGSWPALRHMATKCQRCACRAAFLTWARGAGALPPPAIPAGMSLPLPLSRVLLSGSCWCQPN